jgi:plasmid stabilization system protein ParE
MRVNYAPRAQFDLARIGDHSRRTFGGAVASVLETHLRATVVRIAATRHPCRNYEHTQPRNVVFGYGC